MALINIKTNFSMVFHYGNANEVCIEIPSHSSHNVSHQENIADIDKDVDKW